MRAFALVLAVSLLGGCTGSHWLRPQAFVPPLRHYRIRYADAERRAVLPDGWTLVNHSQGDILHGPEWTTRQRSPNGHGTIERPTFDLFAQNARDGTAIWVQTIPLSVRLGARSLEVLAHQVVTDGLGERLIAIRAERGTHRETQVVSSQIVDEGEAEVSGVPAYLVTIQLSVVGSARAGGAILLTLVLFRPRDLGWRASRVADTSGQPMVVMAGFEVTRDRYDAHRPVFDAMLSRLDVRPE
jgi:hypothetical protein